MARLRLPGQRQSYELGKPREANSLRLEECRPFPSLFFWFGVALRQLVFTPALSLEGEGRGEGGNWLIPQHFTFPALAR